MGVDLIDTADAYGPEIAERLIAEALFPYREGLVIATREGSRGVGADSLRIDPAEWAGLESLAKG